jgi:exonuclease III
MISPDEVVYNIVAIYAPDGNNSTDWTALHNKLVKKPRTRQILIGDYNTTLDPILDRYNYLTDNHIQGREVINSWINNDEYLDAFRYIYPESRSFSWRWDGNQRSKKDKKRQVRPLLGDI